VIEKLENNEQILMMYLAGELPAEDCAEVEQMLASEGPLRRDLGQLQALHARMEEGLGRLDEQSPMPVSGAFAARQVGRAIRQKLAQPKAAPAAAVAERQVRTWWWLYPSVAAASIAIVAMVWLDRQATPTSMPSVLPYVDPNSVANSHEGDDQLLIDSLTPAEEPKQIATATDAIPQDEISQYLLGATPAGN
jgi:hypothetical protein